MDTAQVEPSQGLDRVPQVTGARTQAAHFTANKCVHDTEYECVSLCERGCEREGKVGGESGEVWVSAHACAADSFPPALSSPRCPIHTVS